jgi:lysophospholipase L1-like esterase
VRLGHVIGQDGSSVRRLGRRARNGAVGLLTSLLAILVVFAIGEPIYRGLVLLLKPKYHSSPLPCVGWELTPGARLVERGISIEINSLGFRDEEMPLEKAEDEVRIALIGDSVAFGAWIAARKTFASVAERRLDSSLPQRLVRVLNLGIEGSNTGHHLRILRRRVPRLDPDLIVLAYFPNDIEVNKRERLYNVSPALEGVLRHWRFLNWFLTKAAMVRDDLESRVLARRLEREGNGESLMEHYAAGTVAAYEDPAAWAYQRERLSSFVETCREMETPCLVLLFSFQEQVEGRLDDAPQRLVRDELRAEGTEVIDLLPVLAAEPSGDLYLPDDNIHLNERGHEIVGRVLAEAAEGLLAEDER